jgi:hypothetical protein
VPGSSPARAGSVAGIQAYPAGFSFTLHLRLRNLSAREERQLPYLLDRADLDDDPLADDYLRFGVQFADGRKATTLDRPPHDPEGQEPDRPVLREYGGGGGGTRGRHMVGHRVLGVAAAAGWAVRLRLWVAGQRHRGVARRDRRRNDSRSDRACCDPLALTTSPDSRSVLGPHGNGNRGPRRARTVTVGESESQVTRHTSLRLPAIMTVAVMDLTEAAAAINHNCEELHQDTQNTFSRRLGVRSTLAPAQLCGAGWARLDGR